MPKRVYSPVNTRNGRKMPQQTHDPRRQPLTSDEVMKVLRISRGTFWRYVREEPEHFRTYVSGKRRVMDPEDLEHWREYRKQSDA
jgi:predicted DNA-binding transcriptional regulator AlpA